MHLKKPITIFMLILLFILLYACNPKLISDSAQSKPEEPQVESETNTPPQEPSADEHVLGLPYPGGVCSMDSSGENIACFDIYGRQLASLQIPGLGGPDAQRMHIAGQLGADSPIPPIVFYSWNPIQALFVFENGSAATLRNTGAFLALAGAPSQPVMAFSEVAYEDNAPHSYIYAGNLQTLGSAESFYDLKDELNAMALMPVTVEAANGQPQKVWYTHTAWGIGGGDIIYPINRGLYVFDLTTQQNLQALGYEQNFQGLSPDKTLAGSISFDFNGDLSLQVTNLVTGKSFSFPLNPSSDRGAGYAVFSNEGKYAAWLEASGSMVAEPPTFLTRIRVGEITSMAVVAEIDSVSAAQAMGWERVSFMKPVGWLDAQTVVVEVRGNDWPTAALVKFDIASGNLTVLCPGSFAGFAFP